MLWLTLCGRHCTAATHADLIPPHFTESLTIDTLPAMPEQVISEPDFLCEYCLSAGCASLPLFDKGRSVISLGHALALQLFK
ncbi:hypothetical protein OH690_00245 [Escherichia coli]|nr:hypothetical protein [Escherichia coli]